MGAVSQTDYIGDFMTGPAAKQLKLNCTDLKMSTVTSRGGGVLLYMGYIGIWGPKGYGFSAALVINRLLILAILVLNRIWVLYCILELGMLFRRNYFFIIIDNTISLGQVCHLQRS